jgi:hypothetical protein
VADHVSAVVLFDVVGWIDGKESHSAEKGDTISLPADEFERLNGIYDEARQCNAVEKAGSKAAKAEADGEPAADDAAAEPEPATKPKRSRAKR